MKPGSPAIGGQRCRGRAACKDLVDRDQQLPNREDFYTTLGLPPAATSVQVKAAYLAALGEARSRADIDRLHAAYWVLISPRLRGMHDAELAGPAEVGAELRALREFNGRDLPNAAARLGNLAHAHPYPALLRVAGILLFGTERFSKARRVFQHLCELEPGNGEAPGFLARCLEKEGRRAEADRVVAQIATLDPLEPMACQEVAKKRLFDEMDARGTLEPIDRGLAGSDGAATGRLPLLASSFLPLTLLGEERRREETAGAFLELLPRARISIQHAAIATVHGVANRFPPAEAPRQRRSSRSGPGRKPTRPRRTGSGASSRPRTCCPRSTLAT